jgi:hypothetical protein
VAAPRELAGIGHLSEITAQCELMGNKIPASSIRRLLQQYSTDATWTKSTKPPKAPDLFYSVDGVKKATGFWGLRGFSAEAPGEYPILGLRRAHERLMERSETPLFNVRGIAYRDGSVHAIEVRFAPGAAYPDALLGEGLIEHVGEGREREQMAVGGNRGMLNAIDQRVPIPVFQAVGPDGSRRYAPLGFYRVIDSRRRSLRLEGNDYDTNAFIFTLANASVPLQSATFVSGTALNSETEAPADILSAFGPTTVVQIPVEDQHKEKITVKSSAENREATRVEGALVQRLKTYVEGRQMTAVRHSICPAGEVNALLTDMFIPERNLLVEAKGNTDRVSFRMALGQLADYRRFLDNPRCAILLPRKPRPDLLQLAERESVAVIWPLADSFEGTIPIG